MNVYYASKTHTNASYHTAFHDRDPLEVESAKVA